MVEILKQPQYQPLSIPRQVISIFAGINGFLDMIKTSSVKKFEAEMFQFIEKNYPGVEKDIEEKKEITSELQEKLEKVLGEFKVQFKEDPI
jgi:F-type H+-transporting ATPase subunit alpha